MLRTARCLALVFAVTAAGCIPPPGQSDAPNFKTVCDYVRTAADDPIVFPGQPGASHSHDFFGAVFTSSAVTANELYAAPTSCSDPADHAAYWTPSLYRDGVQVAPTNVSAYYSSPGNTTNRQPYPFGLRIIAGDQHATSPQGNNVTNWICSDGTTSTVDHFASSPAECPGGTIGALNVLFPDCWDGRRVDSPDHKSHQAYSEPPGVCPVSHPVPVPQLTMIVHYPISGGNVTLASGGVYSGHADFINAWDPIVLAGLVQDCLNLPTHCR